MPTIIGAGDAVNGAVVSSSNDGTLALQVGPNGLKTNAIAIAQTGALTLATTVSAAGALPASPLGYLSLTINGVAVRIPYYT